MGILSTIISRVATSIEKLPDRSEFDVVKDELQTARGLIDNAVIPVKKLYDEYKAQELRGEDVYE